MTRDKQRITDYLEHILEAIDRINRYTADTDTSKSILRLFGIQSKKIFRNFTS